MFFACSEGGGGSSRRAKSGLDRALAQGKAHGRSPEDGVLKLLQVLGVPLDEIVLVRDRAFSNKDDQGCSQPLKKR